MGMPKIVQLTPKVEWIRYVRYRIRDCLAYVLSPAKMVNHWVIAHSGLDTNPSQIFIRPDEPD